MRVACIQTNPRMLDKGANVHIMCEWIERTMDLYPDTRLIVFPELSISGYQCEEQFEILAEDIADVQAYSIKKISAYAKKYKVHIVYGFPEKEYKMNTKEISLYNSQILINHFGEILGTYRKVHLFDTEKKWFTPGQEYKVFDTVIGKLGLFICYDAAFPEVARKLTLKGAEILINSTNWEKPYDRELAIFLKARALENTVYLLCSNRIGTDSTLSFFGQSSILNPIGEVLAEQSNEMEDIVSAQLNMEQVRFFRTNYYTMLQERRNDTY